MRHFWADEVSEIPGDRLLIGLGWGRKTAIANCVRAWRLPVIGLVVLLHAAVIGAVSFTPGFRASIASSSIAAEGGAAYIAAVHLDKGFPYVLPVDTMGAPYKSRLALFENGKLLGPSHSLHALIRERGMGRYSHWGDAVIFSSSDGSDPRTNGRRYSVASPTSLNAPLRIVLLAVLVLVDLGFFALFREGILAFFRSWASVLLEALALSAIAAAALAAFGVFGTLVVARSGTPADGALAAHVLQHACLGCVISLGFWAAGAGLSRLWLRDPKASLPQVLIPAFPTGLALLAALAAISLLVPQGRLIASALWAVCLFPLLGWRPPSQELKAAVKAALCIIPLAILFGVWLGLLWHGPTDTLPGSPSGDITFYAGSIWSLAHQPYPFIDLGYENGGARSYFNLLFPALGAALSGLPGFDPFLYLLASGGTAYILLSALMLHLFVADRAPRAVSPFAAFVLVLSFVVAARYPYWVVESIPVVFLPAPTISVWWMAERGRGDVRWGAAAMVAGLGGSVLSKVVSAVVLVPIGAAGLLRQFWILPRPARGVVLGVGFVFGVYCIAMLVRFLPGFIGSAEIGPESFRNPQWWFVFRDVGTVILALLAWRIADPAVALALNIGLATFLLFSFLFQINFVCVVLLLGLMVFTDPEKLTRARWIVLAASASALPAAILSDPAGTSSGVIWIVCLGGAVLAAVSSAVHIDSATAVLKFRTSAAVAITTLAVSGLGLIGVARGNIVADSGWRALGQELTPELKDVWSAVRRLPASCLDFY